MATFVAPDGPAAIDEPPPDHIAPWRVVGLIGVCLLSGLAAWLLWRTPDAPLGIVLWCLLVLALPLPWLRRPRAWTWTSLAMPTAAFLLALVPRLIGNDQLPLGLHGDEAQQVLAAEALVRYGLTGALGDAAWSVPTPGFAWMALWVALLGPTVTAVRVASAVAGALAVAVIYLLGRTLGGPGFGLLAAGLLLVAHTHLLLSHLGTTYVQTDLLAILTIWLLIVSWRRASRLAASLAAISFAGAILNGSGAGPLAPIVGLGFVMMLFWWKRRSGWPPALVFGLGALLLLAPPIFYFTRLTPGWVPILGRLDQLILHPAGWRHATAMLPAPTLVNVLSSQLGGALSAFWPITTGDASAVYSFSRPLIDPVTLGLALFGLGLLMTGPKPSPDWLLPLLVIPVTLIITLLTIDPPSYHRMALLLPAVVLLGGHTLDWLRQRLQHGRIVVIAVLAAVSLLNGQWFFVDYPREGVGDFLIPALADLAAEYQVTVYVLTPNFPFHHESVRLLDPQRRIQPPPNTPSDAEATAVWVAQGPAALVRLEKLERGLPAYERRVITDNRGAIVVQALVPTVESGP